MPFPFSILICPRSLSTPIVYSVLVHVTLLNPNITDINKAYYKYIKASDKGQSRFEFTVVCDNYINSLKAINEAKRSLITLGDETLDNNILTVMGNGGGSLRDLDTGTFHESAFFTITYKERI